MAECAKNGKGSQEWKGSQRNGKMGEESKMGPRRDPRFGRVSGKASEAKFSAK